MKKILLVSCIAFVSGTYASDIPPSPKSMEEGGLTLASNFLSRYTPVYNTKNEVKDFLSIKYGSKTENSEEEVRKLFYSGNNFQKYYINTFSGKGIQKFVKDQIESYNIIPDDYYLHTSFQKMDNSELSEIFFVGYYCLSDREEDLETGAFYFTVVEQTYNEPTRPYFLSVKNYLIRIISNTFKNFEKSFSYEILKEKAEPVARYLKCQTNSLLKKRNAIEIQPNWNNVRLNNNAITIVRQLSPEAQMQLLEQIAIENLEATAALVQKNTSLSNEVTSLSDEVNELKTVGMEAQQNFQNKIDTSNAKIENLQNQLDTSSKEIADLKKQIQELIKEKNIETEPLIIKQEEPISQEEKPKEEKIEETIELPESQNHSASEAEITKGKFRLGRLLYNGELKKTGEVLSAEGKGRFAQDGIIIEENFAGNKLDLSNASFSSSSGKIATFNIPVFFPLELIKDYRSRYINREIGTIFFNMPDESKYAVSNNKIEYIKDDTAIDVIEELRAESKEQ